MGFLGKLFGGKDKPPPPPARRVPPEERSFAPDPRHIEVPPVEEMSVKDLTRQLGTGNSTIREAVEVRLGQLGDRTAMRPLINAYLMHGDAAALEALRQYGGDLTGAARTLADDVSNEGERRARIMGGMGVSGGRRRSAWGTGEA